MLISFIIPAYNAEKTIQRCIESILALGAIPLEIIVVNDGSSDDTALICAGIQDKRIRIISQSHKSAAAARNNGLTNASGDFIMFVDADDFVVTDNLAGIIKNLNIHDKCVMFNNERLYKGIIKANIFEYQPGTFGKRTVSVLMQKLLYVPLYSSWNRKEMYGSACRYFFNRVFLQQNSIFFDEELLFMEDLPFCLKVFSKLDQIKIIDTIGYCCVKTKNSLSRSYRDTMWDDLKAVYSAIDRIINCPLEILYCYFGKCAIKHYLSVKGFRHAKEKISDVLGDEKFIDTLLNTEALGSRSFSERLFDGFCRFHKSAPFYLFYLKYHSEKRILKNSNS